jgi:hypothetical protein
MVITGPVINIEGENVTYMKICSVTERLYTVTISKDEYLKWKGGELIQNVLPHISTEKREFLISGVTPDEFTKLYNDDYTLY